MFMNYLDDHLIINYFPQKEKKFSYKVKKNRQRISKLKFTQNVFKNYANQLNNE